ncbi:MAG: flagellar biosynthetic protein FliR [Pirellulaceae bacterium]
MTEAWILSFALILVRLATFWTFVPVWTALRPPRMVKLGLMLSLSVFWFTSQGGPGDAVLLWATDSQNWALLIVLVVRELVLGGLLAFTFHIFFIPMQIAGAYIGQELGLSLATMTDPSSGAINNIVATILQSIAVVMFFLLDLHHFLVWTIDVSFQLVPVGQPWDLGAAQMGAHAFAELTAAGMSIAMPVAVVMMLGLIALLVLARAVPSLNLFSIGLSIRLLLGLLAMLIFLPQIWNALHAQLESAQALIESLLRSL